MSTQNQREPMEQYVIGYFNNDVAALQTHGFPSSAAIRLKRFIFQELATEKPDKFQETDEANHSTFRRCVLQITLEKLQGDSLNPFQKSTKIGDK